MAVNWDSAGQAAAGVGGAATALIGKEGTSNSAVLSNSQTEQEQSVEEMITTYMLQLQQEQSARESNSTESQATSQTGTGVEQSQQLQIIQNLGLGDTDTLRNLIAGLTSQANNAGSYTPEEATRLSKGASQAAIKQTLEQGFGAVASAGQNAGAYDSTVQGNIASQVTADAATAGAAQELQMQELFAQLRKQEGTEATGALSQLYNVLSGAQQTQSDTGSVNSANTNVGQSTTATQLQELLASLSGSVTAGTEGTKGTNTSKTNATTAELAESAQGEAGLFKKNDVTIDLSEYIQGQIVDGVDGANGGTIANPSGNPVVTPATKPSTTTTTTPTTTIPAKTVLETAPEDRTDDENTQVYSRPYF